jgi:iron complex transport system ATP-binding protein
MELMKPIVLENLSFSYGKDLILTDLSFSIEEGTVTTILGPNGSGKTTLLKLLLGILKPAKGKIRIFSRDAGEYTNKEKARILAYVPQKHIPAFSYQVIDVVAMGRHPYNDLFSHTSKHDLEISAASLERLKISHLAERPYTELSGGEQQLVLIARALTQEAKILVMDEPVSGLDYGNQLLLLEQLRSLARDGITCINTSHYPEHALWTADQVVFLKKGQLIAEGPAPEIVNAENLKNLYQANIKVIQTENSSGPIKTCIPDFKL